MSNLSDCLEIDEPSFIQASKVIFALNPDITKRFKTPNDLIYYMIRFAEEESDFGGKCTLVASFRGFNVTVYKRDWAETGDYLYGAKATVDAALVMEHLTKTPA